MNRTDRKVLRVHALKKRDALPQHVRQQWSHRITDALCAEKLFQEKYRLYVYCNFRSEVATNELIRRCLTLEKEVLVPLTLVNQKKMLAVKIKNPETELEPGYYGIPEPMIRNEDKRITDPKTIEAVIVPGAAFDRNGNRLGYGGGFYDRFLSTAAPQALRIALAFSSQLVECIPTEPHDQPMDMLITEQGILDWQR